MTLGVDNRQLRQALVHFNPPYEDVVTWLRNSELSHQIASLSDEVVRNTVRELFVERLQVLSQFLQNKEIIDASVASDMMGLVDSYPKGDVAVVAVKIQDLLLARITYTLLPLMKMRELSFEHNLVSHFPPYFNFFCHRLATVAFLHEAQLPLSTDRSTIIHDHLQSLIEFPISALFCYNLLKKWTRKSWSQLNLMNSSNGVFGALGDQSPFIQRLVLGLINDPFALHRIENDPVGQETEYIQQVAQCVAKELFYRQRYIQACVMGFNVYSESLQQRQCDDVLHLLSGKKQINDIITLMHQMGQQPFFNQYMEQSLTVFNTLLNPEQFQSCLYLLLSPVKGSPSKPKPLARAAMGWMEKNKHDAHLKLVHDFLRGVRSPVAKDVKSIMDHQELSRDQQGVKEILPQLVGLMVMFGLFILWQQLVLPSATAGAEGSL